MLLLIAFAVAGPLPEHAGGSVVRGERTYRPTQDDVLMIKGPVVENAKWVGPDIRDTKNRGTDRCELVGQVTCYEYGVEIQSDREDDPAWPRLRVAIDADSVDPDDEFWMELYNPNGIWVGHSFTHENGELMVWPTDTNKQQLMKGVWTIRVIPREVKKASFWLRVVLESKAGATKQLPNESLLLPNLRAEPPYSLTFRSFDTATGCSVAETVGSTADSTQDSTADPEPGSSRCLRFNFGYQNIGDGPYEVQLTPKPGVPSTATVKQRVYIQDLTPFDHQDNRKSGAYREGAGTPGTATFHEAPGHMHWHYDNIYQITLHRVLSRTEFENPVLSAKLGACASDSGLVDFERVFQDRMGDHDSGGRCSSTNAPHENLPVQDQEIAIALSRGWSDIYNRELPDNYVRFDHANPEGHYLLHVEVDPGGLLEETNETDNLGYTYFRVSNCSDTLCKAELLERGRGAHPWEDGKTVLKGLGQ